MKKKAGELRELLAAQAGRTAPTAGAQPDRDRVGRLTACAQERAECRALDHVDHEITALSPHPGGVYTSIKTCLYQRTNAAAAWLP